MRIQSALITLLLVIPGVLLPACESTYDPDFTFAPRPASVEVRDFESDRTLARSLVSVVGVRHRVSSEDARPGVEVRMRVENVSDDSVQVDLRSLRLLSADLRELEPPIIVTDVENGVVPPRQTGTITATFAFPLESRDNPFDLSSLTLQWTMIHNGNEGHSEQTFERRIEYIPYHDYDIHHHYGWSFYGGFG
jgi:hypothetical protein